jgi:hypothetical protein
MFHAKFETALAEWVAVVGNDHVITDAPSLLRVDAKITSQIG